MTATTPQNNETLTEVRSILEHDKKVPQTVVNRLILALLADNSERLSVIVVAQEEQDARIGKLEGKSIVMWIDAHPKLSVALLTALLVLCAVIPEYGPALAKAIGIP